MGLLLGLAIAAGYLDLPDEAGTVTSAPIVFLLWLNTAVMLAILVVEARRRPFSLHLMHLLSLFLFFGVAGLYQYSVGRYPIAGSIALYAPYNFTAAASTSIWLFGYIISYELHQRISLPAPSGAASRFLSRPVPITRATLSLCVGLALTAFLAVAGLAGVFTRQAAEQAIADYSAQASSEYNSPLYIISTNLLRAYPLVAFLAGLLLVTRVKRNRRNLPLVLSLLALGSATLVANNPIAAGRFWLVTALFAIAAPYFFRRLRTGSAIVLTTLAGLSILPALGGGEARQAETFTELLRSLRLDSPLEYLSSSGDVDALGMLAAAVKWVDGHGLQWGRQTLGIVLCWVPRTLWPTKPIGTGTMVAEGLGFEFTNFSVPVMAVPIVDFGLVGVLLFAIAFGIVASRLDRLYFDGGAPRENEPPRLLDCIYPFWLGSMVDITRGDLMAAVPQAVAFTFGILPLGIGVLSGRGRSRILESADEPSAPHQ